MSEVTSFYEPIGLTEARLSVVEARLSILIWLTGIQLALTIGIVIELASR